MMAFYRCPTNMAAPPISPETKPFWDATREGKLLVGFCPSCENAFFPPRRFCPLCFEAEAESRPASGKATIYSLSVLRRGVKEPYALAFVRLEEGCLMQTTIVNTDIDAARIGDAVEVVFAPTNGEAAIPLFQPSAR